MNKPIIRHCKNCEWANFRLNYYNHTDGIRCDVKYKIFYNKSQRLRALFCPHFKKKEVGSNGKL